MSRRKLAQNRLPILARHRRYAYPVPATQPIPLDASNPNQFEIPLRGLLHGGRGEPFFSPRVLREDDAALPAVASLPGVSKRPGRDHIGGAVACSQAEALCGMGLDSVVDRGLSRQHSYGGPL